MLLTGEIFPSRIPSKGGQSPSGSRYEEISVTADHVWIWPSLSSLHRSQFPGRLLESFVDPPDIRIWSRKCCPGVSILHVCAASSRRMGGVPCHQVAMLFDWAVTLILTPAPCFPHIDLDQKSVLCALIGWRLDLPRCIQYTVPPYQVALKFRIRRLQSRLPSHKSD